MRASWIFKLSFWLPFFVESFIALRYVASIIPNIRCNFRERSRKYSIRNSYELDLEKRQFPSSNISIAPIWFPSFFVSTHRDVRYAFIKYYIFIDSWIRFCMYIYIYYLLTHFVENIERVCEYNIHDAFKNTSHSS